VKQYISAQDVDWDPVLHGESANSAETARAALLPEGRIAKAVLLEDDDGYVLAVIGANHTLDVEALGGALRRELRLASEYELEELFRDCEPGAVPPLGAAYGIPTVWDDSLGDRRDVYFEAGDHRTLVHMSGADFRKLMHAAWPLRYYLH
jgi:Ala-tRNA(Pro) deacylase